MARSAYVLKNISNLDPGIRSCVIAEAVTRKVTISDVVGEVLAAAWGIEFELSGEQALNLGAGSARQQLLLRIPQEMATRVWLTARTRGLTESSVVQELLAEHFGVEYEPRKRGGATRRRKEVA